ncbi:glycosyltransferase family 2 protein [Helicobacter sp. 11S02629-2]|uniref:glycosyltransferase family 2 protein n=1 Tax=Helicobacter sp. 11S02629-2 TaxID=1476195 RepID=UPI000BA700FB|nr:glycosyltransferase family 2 protein [Helicobacter sp. 11S02629-2]PAF44651.1 hypothetical protein BKH40_05335 [Helicobacter sp. 11S02629-2]
MQEEFSKNIIRDSKLLSICIPTYNGAKSIEKNIDTIIKQIEEEKLNCVEIIVSDNCSTDDTPNIMNAYIKKHKDLIIYSRNKSNVGYDRNVDLCCALAKGKFIHILGDDDYYSFKGLKRLCAVLKEYPDLSLVVLSNYYLRVKHYGQIVSRKHINTKFVIKDKFYKNDCDSFMIDVEDRIWLVSNIVFKKECHEKIPNLKQFYKKDWIHIYMVLYIAKRWQNCYIFADKYPIIVATVDTQAWLNNTDGPRIYFNNIWIYSFANELGYDPKVFKVYSKHMLKDYIKNISYKRSKGLLTNIKYIFKYFRYWFNEPLFYCRFIPKLLLPEIVISLLRGRRHKKEGPKKLECLQSIADVEVVVLCNEVGRFEQFVSGSSYNGMYENLKLLYEKKYVSDEFYKLVSRLRYKKLVPYSTYVLHQQYYAGLVEHYSKIRNL